MSSTSLQRTYRYLRIAIAGSFVVVLVSIAVTVPVVGILPSISHYFYTPANTMFVGAVVAASVCLFALSGRGPERVLLDVAALVLPLVAIVPTTISRGSVPGVDVTCGQTCIPASASATVDSGVATYLIVGVLLVILATWLVATGQVDRRGAVLSIGIAIVVLLTVALSWLFWRAAFFPWAHVVAAVLFFGVIAAVAAVNAFRPSPDRLPGPRTRAAYIGIAVAIILTVIALPIFGTARIGEFTGVFIGETIALGLFVAFWVLRSIESWSDPDPAILATTRT